MEMQVVKRDGRKQPVKFDKITARIKKLAYGLDPMVDIIEVAQKVYIGVFISLVIELIGFLRFVRVFITV